MTTGTAGRPALLLWSAFVAAHLFVALLGWVLPGMPMGDVVLVYQPWSAAALDGGTVMGVTETWVYPQLALVPMMIAQVLATPFAALGTAGAYLIGWALLVTIGDALAFRMLLGGDPHPRRRAAGWFWISALVLLGPVAMYRLDAIALPLALAGGLWLVSRPAWGAALLTVGAWIKIWPAAIVLAVITSGPTRRRVIGGAGAVTAAVIVGLLLLGADRELLGFLSAQAGRGLQIESVAATPFLWAVVVGRAALEYDLDILTYQIVAPEAALVADMLTPIMVAVVAGVLLIGIRSVDRGAHWRRLMPPLALAVTTALIVTNKVGSPQFMTWLIAPVVLWIVFDRSRAWLAVALVLLLCALTFAVYPLTYGALLSGHPLPVVLLSIRNAVLIVLLVHSVWATLRASR